MRIWGNGRADRGGQGDLTFALTDAGTVTSSAEAPASTVDVPEPARAPS